MSHDPFDTIDDPALISRHLTVTCRPPVSLGLPEAVEVNVDFARLVLALWEAGWRTRELCHQAYVQVELAALQAVADAATASAVDVTIAIRSHYCVYYDDGVDGYFRLTAQPRELFALTEAINSATARGRRQIPSAWPDDAEPRLTSAQIAEADPWSVPPVSRPCVPPASSLSEDQ